jgi:subtilisin family serine protease
MMKKSQLFNALNLFMVLVIVILLTSCSQDVIEQESIQEINLSQDVHKTVKDQYIVLLSKHPSVKDNVAAAALESLSKEVGKMQGARLKGTFRRSLTGFVAKLSLKQVEKLKNDPRVLSITPDKLIELSDFAEFNSASVYENPVWGLDRIDQREELLDRAYVYNSTGKGISAYVMDSGIRLSHNEFEGRASFGVDMEFIIDPEEIEPDQEMGNDCHGHGTHVAGTIGGRNFGVAKEVQLISVKVNPKCRNETPLSYLIGGIDWIMNDVAEKSNKGAVVNMSLGNFYDSTFDPLEAAIDNAILAGLNFTISAGNANTIACEFSPARVPGALTVGASDIYNNRAKFSNYGDCLDLYAPGVSITSAGNQDNDATRISSGTSMAAPHVAGLVALFLEKNPEATPIQVHSAIIDNSSTNLIKEVPSGTANLAHSIWEPVVFTAPSPPDLNLRAIGKKEKGSSKVYLVWEPTDDPYISIYKNGSYLARWYNTGEYSLNINGGGKDTFQICEEIYDNCSQTVAANFNDDSGFEPNQPPTASFAYVVDGLKVQFTDTSTDPDGTIVSWTWYFGDGYYSTAQNPVRTYAAPGTYRIELQVADDLRAGDYTIEYITLSVEDPDPRSHRSRSNRSRSRSCPGKY